MKGLKGILAGLTLGMVAAALPLASAQKVSTDYDHKANFETYHTFSFYRVQTANPLFEQRVKDAITRDLQAKGWQMVPSGGDVSITAIGSVKDEMAYTTFYNDLGNYGYGYGGWGGWWGGGWNSGPTTATTTQQTIPVGTLLVDVYDNRTKQLVFRGRASDELHQKHTDKNVEIVNKSVDKIFDHFPPKSSRS